MSDDVMITTLDNDCNPFTQFWDWFNVDTYVKGYRTCERLAALAKTSYDLSEEDNAIAAEEAMDRLIELFPNIPYIKVTPETIKNKKK